MEGEKHYSKKEIRRRRIVMLSAAALTPHTHFTVVKERLNHGKQKMN